jgi:hypothetical protein
MLAIQYKSIRIYQNSVTSIENKHYFIHLKLKLYIYLHKKNHETKSYKKPLIKEIVSCSVSIVLCCLSKYKVQNVSHCHKIRPHVQEIIQQRNVNISGCYYLCTFFKLIP